MGMCVELFLRERGEQPAHSIGLQEQRHWQELGRYGLEVVGAVEAGCAVDRSTDALQRLEVLGVVVGRALEHQVLKEMREARAALDFVFAADVVPDVDLDEGNRMVLGQDDLLYMLSKKYFIILYHFFICLSDPKSTLIQDKVNQSVHHQS